MNYFVGVDVGTGSVRAGIFDELGSQVAFATKNIQTWSPQADFYEQSSRDIWQAVCESVRTAVSKAQVPLKQIKGIGFDATCSLVLLDDADNPVTVSRAGDDDQNIILWMDHRAIAEAHKINETKHEVLKYVGGTISPEMECPKLLWLKSNLPDSWKRARRFLDLADFLTYRAAGDDTRSLCTVVCKWTFQSHRRPEAQSPTDNNAVWGWDESFFRQIGLEDLVSENWIRIGQKVGPMGQALAKGLTQQASLDLGLLPGTSVAIGIIDAHAGGIGTLGAKLGTEEITPDLIEERLAMIAGTSACHMACSKDPILINGIWGPYKSAMIPGMWLTEGGQSAVGALLDHVVHSHVLFPDIQKMSDAKKASIYSILNELVEDLARRKGVHHLAELTRELHVYPDFHGNRSPLADPTLRGMISGLNLASDMDHLVLLYLATLQAICFSTRHILSAMNTNGYRINNIFLTGGLGKNSIFLHQIADITNSTILIPSEQDAVTLGSAILGSVASGVYPSLLEAMAAMNKVQHSVPPTQDAKIQEYYNKKFQVFLAMYEDQMKYRRLMSST